MLELTDLPPQFVPAVDAFANRLVGHVRSRRDSSLEVHEQGVLDVWRAEAAAVLARVVTAATTGADSQTLYVMLLLPQHSSQQARLVELLAGNPAALSQRRTLSGELQDVPAPTGD